MPDTDSNLLGKLRRRFWRPTAIPGWVLFLWFALRVVREGVGILGDIEFLTSAVPWEDISGLIGSVIFSTWFSLACLVLGLAWLGVIGTREPTVSTGEELSPAEDGEPDAGPASITHDGVAYRIEGEYYDGSPKISYPLCPDDFTELGYEEIGGMRSPEYSIWDSTVGGVFGRLYCPQCSKTFEFGLGELQPGKLVIDSHTEARKIFRAKGLT